MPKKAIDKNSPCPIGSVITVFGGKWKPAILFHLENNGTVRFGQLRKLIPDISQRMLTLQLRELERDGMVTRTQFPEIPPRVEYASTKLALSLTPIFKSIEAWGNKQLKSIHKARKHYDD
jgi:DNA-binding HxlR family transcriptional regulator